MFDDNGNKIIEIIEYSDLNNEILRNRLKINFLSYINFYRNCSGKIVFISERKIEEIEKFGFYQLIKKFIDKIEKTNKIEFNISLFYGYYYDKSDYLSGYCSDDLSLLPCTIHSASKYLDKSILKNSKLCIFINFKSKKIISKKKNFFNKKEKIIIKSKLKNHL